MMNEKPCFIVAAMDLRRGIGYKGKLPWPKMLADFKRFRALTLDNPIILGRKTFESYGSKPLPRRQHYVVSRHPTYVPPDAVRASSVESAIRRASFSECRHVSVIGGWEVFREALQQDSVDFMYLTRIEGEFPADVFFPDFPQDDWLLTSEDFFPKDAANPYPYTFLTYARKEQMS
ncbi:MAG: dihydrofolate reductase [Candidatus Ryanbacteria bacterium]|nr:dihydrofolate reductase [Candidatus Ryanbacteria bacterium]